MHFLERNRTWSIRAHSAGPDPQDRAAVTMGSPSSIAPTNGAMTGQRRLRLRTTPNARDRRAGAERHRNLTWLTSGEADVRLVLDADQRRRAMTPPLPEQPYPQPPSSRAKSRTCTCRPSAARRISRTHARRRTVAAPARSELEMLGLSPWLSLLAVLLAVLVAAPGRAPRTRLAGRRRWRRDRACGGPGRGRRSTRAGRPGWPASPPAPRPGTSGARSIAARSSTTSRRTSSRRSSSPASRGRRPLPTLPQFFEQLYVNLAPALSSKYPPGTSLLLAPGAMIGLPGLPVVLMNAAAGALLFAIARRLAGGLTALLAWSIWITSFPVLYFHAMYLSEVPTSLAWLVAWWSLLRWRETRARATSGSPPPPSRSAASLGRSPALRWRSSRDFSSSLTIARRTGGARQLGARAHPLRRSRQPGAALIVGLWSWRSTGDARTTPLSARTRAPTSHSTGSASARAPTSGRRLGSPGTSASPANRSMRSIGDTCPRRSPIVAYSRARMIAHDMWYDWRGGLAALRGRRPGRRAVRPLGRTRRAVAAARLLSVVRPSMDLVALLYRDAPGARDPHRARNRARPWPTCGDAGHRARARARLTRSPRSRSCSPSCIRPRARVALVRNQIAQDHGYYDGFTRLLPRTPSGAIVFVRYARTHNDGLSLVRNVPDRDAAPVWTAYDRGAENERLAALAPERALFLFDEASWTLRPLARACPSCGELVGWFELVGELVR